MFTLPLLILVQLVAAYSGIHYASPDRMVRFMLHTANQQHRFYDSHAADYHDRFQPQCRTVVLVHGWYPQPSGDIFAPVISTLLMAGGTCANVLEVRWCEHYSMPYYTACALIPELAASIADHLVELRRTSVAQTDIEMVGHGVGVHIAGMAARIMRRRLNTAEGVQTIIALEPPGAGFTDFNLEYARFQLRRDDAERVLSMYTSVGTWASTQLFGDYVFMANDGANQPGCGLNCTCDYMKALDYYADSLLEQTFVAHDRAGRKLTLQNAMRLANNAPPGVYHFSTRQVTPPPPPPPPPEVNVKRRFDYDDFDHLNRFDPARRLEEDESRDSLDMYKYYSAHRY